MSSKRNTPGSEPAPGTPALSSQRSQRLHEARDALLDGRPKDALTVCDAEMRPDEGDVEWLLLRAGALHALGRGAEGMEHLIAALRLAPQDPEALFRVGQILLEAEEPAHAERYLALAVRTSGGKKSYAALLKKAHKKALTETRSLGSAGSSLPSAEEHIGAIAVDADRREQAAAAVLQLVAFEQESGMFASRLETALGATRRSVGELRGSSRVRHLLVGGGIGLGALLVVGVVVLVGLRSCRSQEAWTQSIAGIDTAIRQGGSVARHAALSQVVQLHEESSDSDLALRAVWLMAARYLYDDADPSLLDRAQTILDEHASADEPRAILGAALLAVARGHPPGALVNEKSQDDPLFESLRLELLALDGLHRGLHDQVLKWVDQARAARPESQDLPLLALRAALATDQLPRAEGWLKELRAVAKDAPATDLAEASLRLARGDGPAEISPLLAAPVKAEATRLHFGALALAVTLRSWVGNAAAEAPPFDDIEAAIGGDTARALAASEALLDEGWPDYAERALAAGKLETPGSSRLALAVASGDVAAAGALVNETNVRTVHVLGELAVQAAAVGDLALIETCLARLEILGISACEQAATRGRIGLRRGQKLGAATAVTLESCPPAGSMLLYHAERAATAPKQLKEAEATELRQRLLRARGLGQARYQAIGELALARGEPALADEAGRILRVRRLDSRPGLVLQLRAAMANGDYPKLLKLYDEAPDGARKDPLATGFAALGRVARGERKTALRFLDAAAVDEKPQGAAVAFAARHMASMSRRGARKQIEALRHADPSPYVQEALVRALLEARELDNTGPALATAQGAPERRLYLELLAATLAFERAEKREYRRALQAAEKRGREQNNTPVVLEAQLRRVAVIENTPLRRSLLEPLEESLADQLRYDRGAPYLSSLQRLLRRLRGRPLEFPKP
ncbi:MAG: hypothetical protein ABIJ09_16455 [Pseudomonadota bacterium]